MNNLVDEINARLWELGIAFRVELRPVHKNNMDVYGLVVRGEDDRISPVFYPDEEFTQMSIDDMIDILKELYDKDPGIGAHETYFTGEYIKDNVLPRLVSNSNAPFDDRDGVLYLPYLDMIIEFYVPVDSSEEMSASFKIHNEHLDVFDISPRELFHYAIRNIRKRVIVRDMSDILRGYVDYTQPGMFIVMSIDNYTFGAAAILCMDILMEIGETVGEPFLILPSSIHDVIIVPSGLYTDLNAYVSLVTEINRDNVAECDRLTDSVYICEGGYITVYN